MTNIAFCAEVNGHAVEPLMMTLGGEEEQQMTAASAGLVAESLALLPSGSLMPVPHRSDIMSEVVVQRVAAAFIDVLHVICAAPVSLSYIGHYAQSGLC